MTIGLPLIGATSKCTDLSSDEGENYHVVRLSDIVSLKVFTSDDMNLETGGSVWHAGFALAMYLIENPLLVRGKDVVEIGAGCGLAGLTAAVLGARSVTLTDILSQQSHLQSNIKLNRPYFEGTCDNVDSAVLHFGDQELTYQARFCDTCHVENPLIQEGFGLQTFDVVLGADIGYDLSLHQPITRTLSSLLRGYASDEKGDSAASIMPRIALLAEEIRWSDIHKWYLESLCELATAQIPVKCDDDYEGDVTADWGGSSEKDTVVRNNISRSFKHTTTFLVEKKGLDPLIYSDGKSEKMQQRNAIHLVTLISEGYK